MNKQVPDIPVLSIVSGFGTNIRNIKPYIRNTAGNGNFITKQKFKSSVSLLTHTTSQCYPNTTLPVYKSTSTPPQPTCRSRLFFCVVSLTPCCHNTTNDGPVLGYGKFAGAERLVYCQVSPAATAPTSNHPWCNFSVFFLGMIHVVKQAEPA